MKELGMLQKMAPNAFSTKGFYRPASSLSSGGYSSDSSSSSSFYRPEFVTPTNNQEYGGWNKSNGYRSPFDYTDSVHEMDKQLAKIRTSPSKINIEKNKFIAIVDMSNFKPEDIEVILEPGRLTVKAEQEIPLDDTTTITKYFIRKFTIPDDVRNEMIATELNSSGVLKITALRRGTS
jgi:HSP20 family molecular chaperone IbpA